MKRARVLLLLMAACWVLLACSTGSSGERDDPAGAPPASSTPGAAPAGHPAAGTEDDVLTLAAAGAAGTTCFTGPVPDLAWFEVQWKAHADLDSFAFELVDPHGVRSVGPGWIVPPVNYGGRIDYGGSTRWEGWRRAIDDRVLTPSQLDSARSWVPSADQSGLLVLHLRFDPRVTARSAASFTGVRATWTAADGSVGESTVAARARFRGDCR